jgi:hypothetical protein
VTIEQAREALQEALKAPVRPARHVRKELEAKLSEGADPLLERLHSLIKSTDMRTSPLYVRMIQAACVLAPTLPEDVAHTLLDEVANTTKRFHLAR